jgi:hypothetical protein
VNLNTPAWSGLRQGHGQVGSPMSKNGGQHWGITSSVWQCRQQYAVLRVAVCGSPAVCGSAAVYVRQCVRQCATVWHSMTVSVARSVRQCAAVWQIAAVVRQSVAESVVPE